MEAFDSNNRTQDMTAERIQELRLGMRYFFIEYPPENLKKLLWNLYTAWICNSAEHSVKKEIVDMLLFYEGLVQFMEDADSYRKYLEKTVLADVITI